MASPADERLLASVRRHAPRRDVELLGEVDLPRARACSPAIAWREPFAMVMTETFCGNAGRRHAEIASFIRSEEARGDEALPVAAG